MLEKLFINACGIFIYKGRLLIKTKRDFRQFRSNTIYFYQNSNLTCQEVVQKQIFIIFNNLQHT